MRPFNPRFKREMTARKPEGEKKSVEPLFYNRHAQGAPFEGMLAGRPAWLVCGGPSLATMDLSKLDQPGVFTLGLNNSPLVYRPRAWCCVDPPNRFSSNVWIDPGIMKFSPDVFSQNAVAIMRRLEDGSYAKTPTDVSPRDCPNSWFYRRGTGFNHKTFFQDRKLQWGNVEKEGPDSCGVVNIRSVMLVGFRILHALGASRIYIVGADFRMKPGSHYAWDEGKDAAGITHNNQVYAGLNRRFNGIRSVMPKGLKVFNATPESGLLAFPKIDYDKAIRESTQKMSDVTRGWYLREKRKK